MIQFACCDDDTETNDDLDRGQHSTPIILHSECGRRFLSEIAEGFRFGNIHCFCEADGLTHNQIDHILIDKRRHTSIVDIRTFRGADCNSDHYLVIGELRERLSVAKRVEQQVNITKFNILKLKDEEAKQNYQVEISNFATLESSDEVEKELDVNSVWKISEIVSKLQLSRA
ncbi:hypothetical protein ANN_04488 [Periplaneta americana]|uniref:Uncharacterized protein n=1 Tax=Periplaneta americana TaxID=6978 RepID=A0ABQ8TAM3_PERAM|nr:hypothetical protein ANN_04488 [Periplaneta americana]